MREDLKAELFNIALNRARANRYNFTSVLEADLKKYIDDGVDKMTAAEYASEIKRTEARTNTRKLIDAMIAEGRTRNLNESLDYKAFQNVRNSICPLWPFC